MPCRLCSFFSASRFASSISLFPSFSPSASFPSPSLTTSGPSPLLLLLLLDEVLLRFFFFSSPEPELSLLARFFFFFLLFFFFFRELLPELPELSRLRREPESLSEELDDSRLCGLSSSFFSPAMARDPACGDRERTGRGATMGGAPGVGIMPWPGNCPGRWPPSWPGICPGRAPGACGMTKRGPHPPHPPLKLLLEPLALKKFGGTPCTGRRFRARGFPPGPRASSKLTMVPAMFAVLRPCCKLSREK
mmetsp:Transcript_126185/g.362949  ORF Transcript_126185/g.362949 Transcript_126185/m.362949 type:complete len:249 (-) Transcript_126185:95-841(-)